ncbi:MAG: PstS family phosphate ABC transporter substrate-binding protein [Proteobacteria bacterium]|nr:PstS family phosphate ABC transporter substrate-binding protein [Pseudomonadota bacterium]MBU1686845.1 PstS family phosphate ABC transporter substrate-binding protein [Pseudomonadota bacterium]
MFKRGVIVAGACLLVAMGGVGLAQARDYISIVGSSTVYPFATVVAEKFGRISSFKTPAIEATGSGGGLKLFCGGVGVQYPDITNSSRRIKASEVKNCNDNGVKQIVEIKIGYDGIVLANSKKTVPLNISRKELFLALAKNIPDPKGSEMVIPNPYKTWHDINPALPDNAIEVLGPPPTSGTRDAFMELVMEDGGKEFPWIKALGKKDKNAFKQICHSMREDGAFIEAGENDNLIVQKLEVNPKAFGIFGFSYLDQNSDKLQGTLVDGEEPTFEAIADGKYPVSRPLFFYVKKAHVGMIPGIKEFLNEFTSEKAWGDEGYLTDKGLIPMPKAERVKFRNDAGSLNNLSL